MLTLIGISSPLISHHPPVVVMRPTGVKVVYCYRRSVCLSSVCLKVYCDKTVRDRAILPTHANRTP